MATTKCSAGRTFATVTLLLSPKRFLKASTIGGISVLLQVDWIVATSSPSSLALRISSLRSSFPPGGVVVVAAITAPANGSNPNAADADEKGSGLDVGPGT